MGINMLAAVCQSALCGGLIAKVNGQFHAIAIRRRQKIVQPLLFKPAVAVPFWSVLQYQSKLKKEMPWSAAKLICCCIIGTESSFQTPPPKVGCRSGN